MWGKTSKQRKMAGLILGFKEGLILSNSVALLQWVKSSGVRQSKITKKVDLAGLGGNLGLS